MKNINYPSYSSIPVIGRFRWCLELLNSKNLSEKTLLDIGCSTGLLESKLINLKFKKIIALDPSNSAIGFAIKNIKDKRISFLATTAEKLPTKDNSIDLVTIFDVIEHVPVNTENRVFGEIARVLKKDGVVLLTTPNNNFFTNLLDPAWYLGHRHYNPDKLKKMIENSGLIVRKTEVRGSIWSSIYMLWFYVIKWVFGQSLPRWKWIENKEDEGYNKSGIFTLHIEAVK